MIDDRRVWSWLLMALALGGLLWWLSPVLTPFATAALFAYLGNPLVARLERRMSRTAAVGIVFLLIVLALAALLAVIIPSVIDQARSVPGYLVNLQNWYEGVAAPWLAQEFGFSLQSIDLGSALKNLRNYLDDIGRVLPKLLGGITYSGAAVLGWMANLALIPLITFYLLRDWRHLVSRIHQLIPRPLEPTVVGLARESDEVLGAFLRGQMMVVLSLAALYATGLSLAGLKFGMLIGICAGLLSFVPYLGPAVGIVGGVVSAIVTGGDIPINLVLVLLVFGIGQALEGFVLTPALVGDRIGLHPVAVVFAVLAGGQLFGFFGVLLALPVAAVLLVVLRHAHARYLESELYEGEASPPPGDEPGPDPAPALADPGSPAAPEPEQSPGP